MHLDIKQLRKYFKRTLKQLSYGILFFIFIFFCINAISPLDTTYLKRLQSKLIYDSNDNLIHTVLSDDGYWRFYAEKEELPKILIDSVLQFEDQYFYFHPGVNPFSIIRSVFHNMTHDNRIGGSTITMQVARMMNRQPRTYASKFVEMFRALQIEMIFSKKEILQLYFNLAPYGGNIEGVKTAAFFYFGKDLKNLSISEVALLSIIPKHPNKNRPDRYANIQKIRNTLLKKLYQHHIIDQDQYNRATNEQITAHRRQSIMKHPHFTLRPEIATHPAHKITTTLNSQLQHYVESLLKIEVFKNSHRNITNAAAIVIDNRQKNILAYAGSSNFYDNRYGGQNDGIAALRSPGSLLKPFVYARSIDKQLITPSKLIFDIPLNFNGYSPVNFDKKYRGLVEAKEALQLSLNVPAIDLNNMLHTASLYELLTEAGVSSIDKEKKYYGSAIVLGGAEMSLYDITTLYTAFSNNGIQQQLNSIKQTAPMTDGHQLFSKEAAYQVATILSEGYRDEFVISHDALSVPKVAFKTGTSAALKDLWTIGFTKDYTVGIWMGNFDGSSTDGATGIRSASKPLFDIFQYLHRQDQLQWLEKPDTLISKSVCVDPVFLSTAQCKRFQNEDIIKGLSPETTCTALTSEKLEFLIKDGEIDDVTSLYNNKCYRHITRQKPIITAPQNNANIVMSVTESGILNSSDLLQKLMLTCHSFQIDSSIHWFIDGKNALKTDSGKPTFIHIPVGSHTLKCVDSLSQTASIHITIEN